MIFTRSDRTSYDYRTSCFQKDDFTAGTGTSSNIGELQWTQSNGTLTVPTAAGHPGIIRQDTGAGAGTLCCLVNASAGNPLWFANELFDMTWVVRLNTNDTDTQMRIGATSSGTGDPASNGIFVEKLYADTSWFGVVRASAAQTRTAALAACSTNWLTVRIRQTTAGTILFSLDGAAEVSQGGGNVPGATGLVPWIQIKNQSAASKTYDIDYYELTITGLSRT